MVFAAVANTWLLGRRHAAIDLRSLPVILGRTAAAAAVGTAAGAVVYGLLGPVVGTGLVSELLLVSSVGLTLLGVFIAILYALRAPERRLLTDADRCGGAPATMNDVVCGFCLLRGSNEDERRASEVLAQRVVAEHGCQRLLRQ